MAVNKVEVNGETKLDLTQDTVTPENLLSGATAHNAAGEPISGAVAVAEASTTTPKAPGKAAVGTEQKYARGDHVHPQEVSAADRAAWNGKASKPTVTTVTLTAAGWNATTKKQTVTVPGVLADTSKQVIWVTQTTEAAVDAYLNAGIVPVAQAANTVTLRADTVPTADITVNIVVQEVQ